MASLAAVVKSYRAKKGTITKLRRKSEKKLKTALLQKRRSYSALASLERKKEDIVRKREHAAQLLNQYLAQKASIERLKIAAEERLRYEQDARDQAKQQSEYGGPEEKAATEQRIKITDDKIAELHAEIKEREAAQGRLVHQIENLQKEKAKLDGQLKNQVHAKPGLLEQLKSSEKAESSLRPKVQSLLRREAQTSKALQSMTKKLAILEAERKKARRRKAAQKARRKAKRAKKRKPAKRKARTKTRKAKRKMVKRKAKVRRSKSKRRK
jgi:chromosome segregation ATPase